MRASKTQDEAIQAHNTHINEYYDSPAVQLFEQLAKQQIHLGYWDEKYPNITVDQAATRLTQVVLDYLKVPRHGTLLDIGCGCGLPALEIARQKHCRVSGITINPQQQAKASALAAAQNMSGQVAFRVGDARQLPYSHDSFDAALMFESIHHIGHRQALREAYKVLKPGAQLLVADGVVIKEDACAQASARLAEIFVSQSVCTVDELHALMQEEGFELKEEVDLTPRILPTWHKLVQATRNNKAAISANSGAEFYATLLAFWEEIEHLWQSSARYLLLHGIKQ